MLDDDDFEAEEAWDEYAWERFLQEQDRNTEKYFGLLEKYIDHPKRDELIAQEMGWNGPHDEAEYSEISELIEQELVEEGDCDLVGEDDFDRFAQSPVYRDTLRLHRWINAWLEAEDSVKDHPAAVKFATRSAVCGAKLAAALCGDEVTEIGMTIAYLKRALKAANDALDAASQLVQLGFLDERQHAVVRKLIFRIRDRVVDFMSEYRMEWRRRHGDS